MHDDNGVGNDDGNDDVMMMMVILMVLAVVLIMVMVILIYTTSVALYPLIFICQLGDDGGKVRCEATFVYCIR